MSPQEQARLLALLRGEQVGEACRGFWEPTGEMLKPGSPIFDNSGCKGAACKKCNGTGRIRTEPENNVEQEIVVMRVERDGLRYALEAERAAHQRTKDADALLVADTIAAHEETKRQLAEAQGAPWRASYFAMREERDQALRERDESQAWARLADAERNQFARERDEAQRRAHAMDVEVEQALREKAEAEKRRPPCVETVQPHEQLPRQCREPAFYCGAHRFNGETDALRRLKAAEQRASEAEARAERAENRHTPIDALVMEASLREAEAARDIAQAEADQALEDRVLSAARIKALEAARDAAVAKRDVWSGKACEEEQAAGNGPCGACRFCLPRLLNQAEKNHERTLDRLAVDQAHIETLREALLAVLTGCNGDDWLDSSTPIRVKEQLRKALATTPTSGLMEKKR